MIRSGLVFLLLGSAQLFGCVCAGWPSAKDAWQGSPVVFLGYVESIQPVESAKGFEPQTAVVRVDEAFKGSRRGQTFKLSQEGNDCSPKFKAGERVLFYLFPAETAGLWNAPGCHRSRDLDSAADDLLFLRHLPDSAHGNRLSGEIEVYENSGPNGFQRSGGLPGVTVTISSEKGAPIRTATNGDGVYEVYGLPPGTYKVDIEVPKGLRIYFPLITGKRLPGDKKASATLGPDSGVSVGFVLMADTRISGRVLDPRGKPMKGVCIRLEAASDKENTVRVFGCTSAEGNYKIEQMPPGQYRVVANSGNQLTARTPFPKLYYPGTTDPQKAELVTVAASGATEGIDIRVPAMEKVVRLSGQVLFSDGAAVPKAFVNFQAGDGKYEEYSLAKDDGSFSFPVVSGKPGEVRANISVTQDEASKCPQFQATFRENALMTMLQTGSWQIPGESDSANIRLVLSVPSCKSWPAH
jgi:protocatechuate 3,4-dioxygenase beta subunit